VAGRETLRWLIKPKSYPQGAGPSRSVRRLDRLGLRPHPQWSGTRFTCSWVMPRRPSGHLNRRIAAQRVRAAAVTRMYQRGRSAPLPGIRVNGGVVESRLAASRSHAGNDVTKPDLDLRLPRRLRIRVMRGKLGGGEDN
jgi:hypothetical protein